MSENLVEKYTKMGFLDGVETSKDELSQVYEDSLNFLIEIGEDKLVWGEFNVVVAFIPLMRKLFVDYVETDYENIFYLLKEWYYTKGVLISLDVKDYQVELLDEFIAYYKNINNLK